MCWWRGWFGCWPCKREQCKGSPPAPESRLQDNWECESSLGCREGNSDPVHSHAVVKDKMAASRIFPCRDRTDYREGMCRWVTALVSGLLEQMSGSGQPSAEIPPGYVRAPWGQEIGQLEKLWCPSGWLHLKGF